MPVNAWYEVIGEPTLADAICDRLLHPAHRIELKGQSMRETKALDQARGKKAGVKAGRKGA